MTEMEIHQILKLNCYKNLQERCTDDVDGDCISFNLYRNTKSSIVLLKTMNRRFQKSRVLPDLSTTFLFEELSQIHWSISKKKTKQLESLWDKNSR